MTTSTITTLANMTYIQHTETEARFTFRDLVAYLGESLANDFMYAYRSSISMVDSVLMSIKCCNLGELCHRVKTGKFLNCSE